MSPDAAAARRAELARIFKEVQLVPNGAAGDIAFEAIKTAEDARKLIEEKAAQAAENDNAKGQLLGILDMLWMTNLEDLEALSESVGLRAYGQRDPLVEYRHEASHLFKDFWNNFNSMVFANAFKLVGATGQSAGGGNTNPNRAVLQSSGTSAHSGKIGRNEKCPCGSGKKYKHCHGA